MTKITVVTTPPCPLCHKTSIVRLWSEAYARWISGELIQDVWPSMSAEDRELLMTGTHSICWNKMWADAADAAENLLFILIEDIEEEK